MKRFLFIYLLILIISGCKDITKKSFEDFFQGPNISKQELLFKKLELDTILLDKIESSYVGITTIFNDTILFIDQKFCWVFKFNSEGKFISRELGQGRGPGELNTSQIDSYLDLNNGTHLFLGSSWDVHLFNDNWLRIKQFTINWQGHYPDKSKIVNPLPDEPSVYTIEYENLILRSDSHGDIFIPIYSELDSFNGFNSTDYYKNGRILAKLNVKDGKITNLLGRRSPEYLKHKYLGHHSFFSYDIDGMDNFYISHEIDSLIYVYDSDFNFLYSFGNAGKEMDTNYQQIKEFNLKRIRELYFVDRPKRGYYGNIKFFNGMNLLFRSYKKSATSLTEGLQIYKNNVLIADVSIPKDFKVIGYVKPYFFSTSIIDEVNEKIKIYRFRLPIGE